VDFILHTGLLWLARGTVGAVFLVAGLTKLRKPAAFEATVRQYRILPLAPAVILSHTLPYAEVAVGTMMVVGVLSIYASVVVTFMLLLFMTATLVRVRRGQALSCGCFGAGGNESGRRVIARNIGLTMLTASSVVSPTGLFAVGPTIIDAQILYLTLIPAGLLAFASASTPYVSRMTAAHRQRGPGQSTPLCRAGDGNHFVSPPILGSCHCIGGSSVRLEFAPPEHGAVAQCFCSLRGLLRVQGILLLCPAWLRCVPVLCSRHEDRCLHLQAML
jgi:uncharacterized membrane protein YphA (DoxX/SURF4 family)